MQNRSKLVSFASWSTLLKPPKKIELQSLLKMMMGLYTEDPSNYKISVAQAKRTINHLIKNPSVGTIVVAKFESQKTAPCLGYALLIPYWSNEVGGYICTIDELFIDPKFRSQGLSTQLLRLLQNRKITPFKKCVALQLEVSPRNVRAKALYKKLGFKPIKNSIWRTMPQ